MPDIIQTFSARGDLAHLALLAWALSSTAIAWFALRELTAASRRFDDFVRELARFNETFRVPDAAPRETARRRTGTRKS
ncbi:MAG TPA: hypothetical protein VGM57_13070 [Pseudolabrys sp.]|jgi:hypothetical protein